MPRIKNPAYLGIALCLVLLWAVLSPALIQAQTQRVKVSIVCNGKVITDQPMPILAGQAINLSYTASGGGSVVYPTWQASWTTVADYHPTLESGKVTPVDVYQLKQPTLKFHWIDQGPKQVTLLFYLSSGCIEGPANCVRQGSVTAKFNVLGPTNVKVTPVTSGTITTETAKNLPVTGKVACFDGGTQVGLGDGKTSAGIGFTASGTMPSGSSGVFGWIQLVNSDNYQYSGSNLTPASQSYHGLDVPPDVKPPTYMYGYGSSVDDSPSMALGSGTGFTKVSRQMTATMYLMWLADSALDTIPVPLGVITWFTGWTVTFNPSSTDTCKWAVSGAYARSYGYVPSIQYPMWTGASMPMPPTTN